MTGSQDMLLDTDRPEVRPLGKQDRPPVDEATRITVEDFAVPASKDSAERVGEGATEGRERGRQAVDTLDYVQDIMATLREPVLVLSG